MLKQLPKKGIIMLCYLFNAALRLCHFPTQCKKAQVIVLPKPGKPFHDLASYRPISIIGKVFEKLFQLKIESHTTISGKIPDYQMEQVHHVAVKIRNTLEMKKFCLAASLDIATAFDKVWHPGLISELRDCLPSNLATILVSFLCNRTFRVAHDSEVSPWLPIVSGVPQGVFYYQSYTCFMLPMPQTQKTTIAMFADDTAILSTATTFAEANNKLQQSLNRYNQWIQKWCIKISATKSKHVVFTLNRRYLFHPFHFDTDEIPLSQLVKYLGITLESRLNWSVNISEKKAIVNEKVRKLYGILNKKSTSKPNAWCTQ